MAQEIKKLSSMSKKQFAFTLIELLVVIAIIGILSGLIVVSMGGVTDKATIAKAQVFSNSLRNSLMLNLVSEYKFETDASDSWGTNTGVITGATVVSNCVIDSCLNFTGGTTNNVSVADSATLDSIWNTSHNFTLEAWINPILFVGYQGIINKRNSGYYSASPGGLFIDNTGINLSLTMGTGNAAETATSANYTLSRFNTWIHVVGTSNGSQLKLYINGIAGNPVSFTQNPPANDDALMIGAWSINSRPFSGKIDNVRLYSAAIPISQVKERYYIGLNSLLINKQITGEEYQQRLAEIQNKTARE